MMILNHHDDIILFTWVVWMLVSSLIDSSSNKDLYFISVGIPKFQLGPNEKDYTFFSMNKVCSPMIDSLLDRFRDIFNMPESIRLIPQVFGIS